MSRQPKIKSNVIIDRDMQELTPLEKNKTQSVRFREVEPRSMAEKIAKDKLYYRNYYYPGGKGAFPEFPVLQTVDKFFPYAEGGPLFVDEVSRTTDTKLIEKKTEVMRSLGHRYVAIMPGMSELDIRERLA